VVPLDRSRQASRAAATWKAQRAHSFPRFSRVFSMVWGLVHGRSSAAPRPTSWSLPGGARQCAVAGGAERSDGSKDSRSATPWSTARVPDMALP